MKKQALRLVEPVEQSSAEREATQNRERLGDYYSQVERLRYLATRAIDTVEAALDDDDPRIRLAAAALIMRAIKLHDVGPPQGSTDPRAIERDRALSEMLANL